MTGVEIGVFHGDSSIEFMQRVGFMYFIDPCHDYADYVDRGYYCTEKIFHAKLAAFKGRYKFIKGFSAQAADEIPEVDFVFIDGNHEYSYVKKDIALYWPKIKTSGFLSGHDYSEGHEDVIKAVDEFAASRSTTPEIYGDCWVIQNL